MIEESKPEKSKTNPWAIIIFCAAVLFLLLLRYWDDHKYDDYRKTFKGETIGFATRYKHFPKSTYIKYYFYKDGKILSSMKVTGNNNLILKKYYKVKYDLKNPRANYIILNEELKPDSITLVKAGFTKSKYYIYDAGVSCKYIEKSKWK